MGGCESGEVDGLDLLEPAFRMQETDGITCDETSERVADNTELFYGGAIAFKLLKKSLDLLSDPLSASFDAIVCVAA